MRPRSNRDQAGVRRSCICGRLLGVQVGPSLEIKCRDTHLVIDGRVLVTCGRCQRTTVLAASGIAAVVGRLLSGWLVDRFYGPYVAVGFFALLASCGMLMSTSFRPKKLSKAEGVRRAIARAGEADLVMMVVEAGSPPGWLSVIPGPAAIALRTEATIVPAFIFRNKDDSFRVELLPPVTDHLSGDRQPRLNIRQKRGRHRCGYSK